MLRQVLGKSCNQLTEAERWVKQDAHMLQEIQQQVRAGSREIHGPWPARLLVSHFMQKAALSWIRTLYSISHFVLIAQFCD